MGFFKSKPKVSIEDCCKEFYDSTIFHAIIAGGDVWSDFLHTVSQSVVEADPSFSSIDSNKFRKEMTALRMEVFALACQRRTKNEDLAVRQSFFTRRYLEETAKLDIWRIMGEYNERIGHSVCSDESGQITNKLLVLRINNLRYDMMDKWIQANIPNPQSPTQKDKVRLKYASRAAMRIGADMRQADCVLAKLLASRLAARLGCDINLIDEALFRLAATTFGFYKGAEDYLKSVNL